MTLQIDTSKCCTYTGHCDSECSCKCECKTPCETCVESCPTGALKNEKGIQIDISLCSECGICIDACSNGALSLN